jgi:hypothetical protein
MTTSTIQVLDAPTCEGWWIYKHGTNTSIVWVYDIQDDELHKELSIYVPTLQIIAPISSFNNPGMRWAGPINLPKHWSEE